MLRVLEELGREAELNIARRWPATGRYPNPASPRHAVRGARPRDRGPALRSPRAGIEELRSSFESIYRQTFGLCFEGRPIEIVNWKAEAVGPSPAAEGAYRVLVQQRPGGCEGERLAWEPDLSGFAPYRVFDRSLFKAGDSIEGPALIEENEFDLRRRP